MHILLREHLEGYLSGKLPPAQQQAVEAHLAECAECRREWNGFRQSAEQLRILRPPRDLEWELPVGFYARLMERIDRDREVPFWSMLLDPAFGRRVVFACLVLLAVLGAYIAAFEQADYTNQHLPEAVLAGQRVPGRPAAPAPRLGPNLDRNRGAVLAALVSEGD